MSEDENTSEPLSETATDDIAPPEKTPEEMLNDAVKLASVAITVAQEAVAKVDEAAEISDFTPEEIERAREQANAALEGAQAALAVAKDQAGEQEDHKPTLEDLSRQAGEIYDRLERRREYERQEEERKAEEERKRKELEEAEEKRKQRAIEEAADKEAKEKEEQEAQERERIAAEEKRKAEEERREKASTPEGRRELARERKKELKIINDDRQAKLEVVKTGLKSRYSELQGSVKTMFLLPYFRPLNIERANDQDEPRLVCYFGSLKKTENGYRTDKFRTVITVAQEEGKFRLEHEAWKGFTDGRERLTRYGWGTDMNGPKPNPREDITFEQVLETMHTRLDDVEKEHESMALGRIIRAGVLAAALAAAAAYHEKVGADTLDDFLDRDEDESHLIITQPTRSLLPEGFVYELDGLEAVEATDEPGF